MSKCKNCGHKLNSRHDKHDINIRGTWFERERCYHYNCACTNPEPETKKVVVEYNKNPHGKAEMGITEAEVKQ